jgi:hypothetical protein
MKLKRIIKRWKQWSSTPQAKEFKEDLGDGWEGIFPDWGDLINIACQSMLNKNFTIDNYEDIEFCWLISEETEDLQDFAKENIEACQNVLIKLYNSNFNDVRWQVYDVFGFNYTNKSQAMILLEKAVQNDQDEYCVKRARLALERLNNYK